VKVKIHLCGQAVKYDVVKRRGDDLPPMESRPQGSLYGWQKRKIADATEWLRLKAKYPLIFCLTSPGYTSLANTTDAISKFINNCRNRHGLGHYVWVREFTKKGFPHFHFIADWHPVDYWFEKENGKTKINRLSEYWSGLLGSDANNSIRLGSYHPATKRRSYYVTSSRQCWYLAKYIGKNIGQGSMDYLAEAGFPQMDYKKTIRSFHVSTELAKLSEPVEYESDWHYITEKKTLLTEVQRAVERSWVNTETGEITDEYLKKYRWINTGHGDTFLGYLKRNARNPAENR
jgi:hypothetical protein